MDRRTFLKGVGLAALGTAAARAASGRRPNVLWIISEDTGPELGCYGYPGVRTPNLDRLAREGTRYTNAFTVTPVCSSSRSSFMTGMHAQAIGAHNHRSHREGMPDGPNPLPDGVRVLTDWLRDAGYRTANLVQLSDDPADAWFSGTGKTDWNFAYTSPHGKPYDTDRWSDLLDGTPFYAQVNFPETHRGHAWDTAHMHIDHPADPCAVSPPPYYPDHPLVRQDWAQYLNTVMSLDRKVGFVLDRLDRDGLADDTVVIYFGDHGRAHVRGKQWCYDSGLHVPLIIRWPKNFPAPEGFTPGGVDDRLVASIDLTAATLGMAGVPVPAAMQGRDFLGGAPPRDCVFGGRDRGDETVLRIRTARTKRYRYIRNYEPEKPFLTLNRYKECSYPVLPLLRKLHAQGRLEGPPARLMDPTRPAEELYDIEADPWEVENLADDPAHRAVLEDLRARTEAWVEDIGDRGRIPEPPEVVAFHENALREAYQQRLETLAREWEIETPR